MRDRQRRKSSFVCYGLLSEPYPCNKRKRLCMRRAIRATRWLAMTEEVHQT